MENETSDIFLQLNEILSCIMILQKAVLNEAEQGDLTYNDIANYLEILKNKMESTIEFYSAIFD